MAVAGMQGIASNISMFTVQIRFLIGEQDLGMKNEGELHQV